MTLLDRVTQARRGEPVRPAMPVEISAGSLTPADPSTIRGVSYWIHKQYGILRERVGLLDSEEEFGNTPFVTVDQDGRWRLRVFSFVTEKEWQRLSSPSTRMSQGAASIQPVDSLRMLATFRPTRELFLADVKPELDVTSEAAIAYAVSHRGRTGSARVPGKPRAATVPEMLARFERAGITFEVVAGGRIVAKAAKGRTTDFHKEAMRRSAPLLAAHLSGAPLRCYRCDEPAVTLLDPQDVPACRGHAS